MKFLFIIQGEGKGHLTQAISLSKILKKHHHEVEEVFMGKSPQRDIPSWAEQEIGFRISYFNSPNFKRRKDKKGIRIFYSCIYNFFRTPLYIYSIFYLISQIRKSESDVVINFYDLIGGLACCFLQKSKKVITVSHQHFFQHPVFEWPKKYNLQKFLLILHSRLTSLAANRVIALSFTEEMDLPEKKLYIIPPLIETDFITARLEKSYIFIYLLNEGFIEEINTLAHDHSDKKFIIFSDNDEIKTPSNVILNIPERKKFLSYLPNAKAVISTSGFETLSETFYFHKPLHPIPSLGHYEQLCNAVDAKRAGLINDYGNLNSKRLFTLADENAMKSYKSWIDKSEERIMEVLHSL